jgi:hypothetical protein
MMDSWIEPHPPTSFAELPISESEQVVLELVVSPGGTLHACGLPGQTRLPYTRHHGVTRAATREETIAIVKSREVTAVFPSRRSL